MRHRSPLLAGLAAPLAAVVAVTALLASPAGAHGETGVLTVEAGHPAGQGVHYIVRLTYENDGDAATGATVTATAVGPDGSALAPVELTPLDSDGRYANVVNFPSPGSWTVRFAASEPEATAEVVEDVSPPPATAGDGATTGSTATGGGLAFAPADDGTGASGQSDADDDSSGMPLWLVAVAFLVVVGGAIAALWVIARYRAEAAREAQQFDDLEQARAADRERHRSAADRGTGA